MMKKVLLLLAAAMSFAAVANAQWADTDTVKVIKNPERVTITRSGGEVLLNVDGYGLGKRYEYQYRVAPDGNGRLATSHREGRNWSLNHPFRAEDTVSTKPHFEFFLSDFHFGWGGAAVSDGDAMKSSINEIGVLNVIGLGYVFNANRSRISLGVGFKWSNFGLRNPYCWTRSDDGVLGYERMEFKHSKHKAKLQVRSMQVPLMFNQSLGKKWSVAVGGVMNWNCYASATTHYRIDKTDTDVTVRGLNQRKISFDVYAMVAWRSLGVYFRYAPQSVLKDGYGPEYKNRWMLGITLLH